MISPSGVQNASREMIISFEDLYKKGRPIGPLPIGYAGCTWSTSAWFLTRKAYPSARMRDQCALLNANGHDLSFQIKGLFRLESLSLSSPWVDEVDVVLEGWAKEVKKYSRGLIVSMNTIIDFTLNYRHIDRVSLRTRGALIVVDDITLLLDRDHSAHG